MRTLLLALVAALAITNGEAKAEPLKITIGQPKKSDHDIQLIRNMRCLRDAVYTEARGESKFGQLMVAHVVYMRAKGDRTKFCAVVYEKHRRKDGKWVYQFSGPNTHPVRMDDNDPKLRFASEIAVRVGLGYFLPDDPDLRCATHFQNVATADAELSAWFENLRYVDTIGRHSFYCVKQVKTASK